MPLIKPLIVLTTSLFLTIPTLTLPARASGEGAPTHAAGELIRSDFERKGSVVVAQTYELANVHADSVTLKTYGCKGELLASDTFSTPTDPGWDKAMAVGGQSRFGARSSAIIFKKAGLASTTLKVTFPRPAKCAPTGKVKPVINHPRGKVFLTLKRRNGKIVSQAYEVERVRATFIAVKTYNCRGKLISWVGSTAKGKKVRLYKVYTRKGAHHSKVVFRKKGHKPVVKRVNFPAPHRCG